MAMKGCLTSDFGGSASAFSEEFAASATGGALFCSDVTASDKLWTLRAFDAFDAYGGFEGAGTGVDSCTVEISAGLEKSCAFDASSAFEGTDTGVASSAVVIPAEIESSGALAAWESFEIA